MAYKTLDQHLFDTGPKRILALDGGGIRGALTLGYLAKIESMLRDRVDGDSDFRLCDYFDLISGTSTGSIIAAGLALGFSVQKLQDIYQTLADKVFEEGFLRFGVFNAKFPKEPLVEALKSYFGDETMGSDKLRTGLMVMTKRLDTGSPWLLHNNPRGKYYGARPGSTYTPNRDYLIRTVVRASAAAPHYFEPEQIQISPDTIGAFVDGGVSPYNNPALQSLMLATLSGYGLNWPFGEDQLMLVSVGTGFRGTKMDPADVMKMSAVNLAAQSILSIMEDANWLEQAVLQWMSHSPTSWKIDSEVGDLRTDVLGNGQPLISYLRYNVTLEPDWLKQTLNLDLTDKKCAALYAMDDPDNVEELTELGRNAAAVQIEDTHFPAGFDI
ncbi:MAG: patatin-like phospholipase family protein [Anaerolineae bacterium]|nr:patatin-like phospholipase family protein [Anaerolineae bacterium]